MEPRAEALRECCEDIKGLGICSHPESCPSCRIFKALAADIVEVDRMRLNHHVDSLNMARCVNGGQQWPRGEVIAWMQRHGDTDEEIRAYLKGQSNARTP